ncbi:outer membrane protein assembly factor BamB family protein [Porticoccus sp.]
MNVSRIQRTKKVAKVAVCALSLLGSFSLSAVAADNPNNWPEYYRDSNAWRYSPLDQINTDNVKKLKVAWIHQPGDIQMGLQATPIAIDGILYYVAANNNVYAVDGKSGKTLWHYQPELDPMSATSFWAAQSRGVAVGHGNVYLGSLDGRFIALDQKSGKEKWSTQLTDFHNCRGCNFSFPPQLAGDILYSGHTGGDQPQQGKIFGVNAKTGELVWTFNAIKDDPKSWPGDSGKVGGSGAWMPGVYDAKTDTILIGTSNAAPDFFSEGRKGDNLYSASILAMEGKTGKLKWYHQEVPHDSWDYDSAFEIMTIEHEGKELLVHLNKGGYVSVLDKATGKPYNVWKFTEKANWVDSVDPKTGELIGRKDPVAGVEATFCPSVLGARSWNQAAYNPKTKLWYSNGWDFCNTVVPAAQDPEQLGWAGVFFGISKLELIPPPGQKSGSARLDARDPITGKVKWTVDYPVPGMNSVLTTAGGLVFNGDATGVYKAYDADNGKELWNFNAGSGFRSGPISYGVDGKQYILVPSGLGGLALGFATGAFPNLIGLPGGAALIAFTLDD